MPENTRPAGSDELTVQPVSTSPVPQRSTEWGLASLVLGGIMLLMAPLLLIAFAVAVGVHYRDWGRDTLAGFILFVSGTFCMCPLYIMAFLAGLLGVRAAMKSKNPAGLPVSGILVSVVAALLWLFVMIHIIGSMASMF